MARTQPFQAFDKVWLKKKIGPITTELTLEYPTSVCPVGKIAEKAVC